MGVDDEATTRREGDTTRDEPTTPIVLPRTPIERYRIADAIGRGGMGEVLDAHDLVIGRDVAIKRLRREPQSRSIERFVREAKIQARLDHPSIVPVYEVGYDNDGRPYFAMKKLTGTTLAKLLKTATLQRLLRAFTDVCNAVEYAHQHGIVHRDLKPENIMLGDYGETYVLDWGIAKVAGEEDLRITDEHAGTLTRAGAVIGTPGYLSPEQARGQTDIDRRADVYALGCILFEILTGGRPLHPSGERGIQSAIAGYTERPSSESMERYVPPELDELCAHATAPDRDLRVQSARELGDGVQRYLDGDRDHSARTALAKEHLEAATRAFNRGDHETALRGAARAIALDPKLGSAAELVTRCVLEPPVNVPPEVEAALDVDSDHIVRRAAKRIALTNLAYLVLLPFFLTQMHWGYTVALVATVGIKGFVTWYVKDWTKSRMRYVRLVFNMFNMAILVRLCSPILLVPSAAAITAMGLMSGTFRTVRDGLIVGGGLTIAALLPWLGELTGVLSPTFSYHAGTLLIEAPLVATELGMWSFVAMQTAGVVLLSIVTTNGIRMAERAARRQVRLQAWRLSQLVPTGASP